MRVKMPTEEMGEKLEKRLGPELEKLRKSISRPGHSLPTSGTTAMAIRYKNGILVAADSKISEWWKTFSHDAKKIAIISGHSVVTYAGTVAIIQLIIDFFKNFLRAFETDYELELGLRGQAKVLKAIVRYIGLSIGDYNVFILAGYDKKKNDFRIFTYDGWGGIYEMKKYIAIGSGGQDAKVTIKNHWNEDLEAADALILGVKALMISGDEDHFTDHPELYPPTMYWIQKEGILTPPREKILETARRLRGGDWK